MESFHAAVTKSRAEIDPNTGVSGGGIAALADPGLPAADRHRSDLRHAPGGRLDRERWPADQVAGRERVAGPSRVDHIRIGGWRLALGEASAARVELDHPLSVQVRNRGALELGCEGKLWRQRRQALGEELEADQLDV